MGCMLDVDADVGGRGETRQDKNTRIRGATTYTVYSMEYSEQVSVCSHCKSPILDISSTLSINGRNDARG